MWKIAVLAGCLAVAGCVPPIRNENGVAVDVSSDMPREFRGITWGADISTLEKEMRLSEEDGGTKWYVRTNENLHIGDAKVSKISYGFYKGKFYYGMIMFSGDANFYTLKNIMFEKYGSGFQNNQFMESYDFSGTEIMIRLDYKEIVQDGTIVIANREIIAQEQEDRRIKDKAAGSEF